MSTVAAERWTTTERGECLLCTAEDRPMVDTHLDIGEQRVYVCEECGTRLAKVLRVGSKATAAVREQYEGEIAERDQRIRSLSDTLSEREKTIETQREEMARRGDALAQAKALASGAEASLQQLGRL